jgi:phosphatidylglycerol---prolipoprotein diacylglyceryl transferase
VHPVLFKIGALIIPSYGALAATGVLLALFLAQRTARTVGVAPNHVWNLSVVALFAALAGSRLLLVAVNWHDLRRHPLWTFGLSTIHSPVLAGIVALLGALAAFCYMRWQRMPWAATLDVLCAPLVLALACEQWGALLAGSDYGTDASVPWAVTYTHPLAARWSGTPLGIPLHPVQAYAALAYLTLAVALLLVLPARPQAGDAAGFAFMGIGITLYITEFWRDPEGRGQLLHGALDGPQVAAILLVALGALMLRERGRPKPAQPVGGPHE